jgi:hypothetical protein
VYSIFCWFFVIIIGIPVCTGGSQHDDRMRRERKEKEYNSMCITNDIPRSEDSKVGLYFFSTKSLARPATPPKETQYNPYAYYQYFLLLRLQTKYPHAPTERAITIFITPSTPVSIPPPSRQRVQIHRNAPSQATSVWPLRWLVGAARSGRGEGISTSGPWCCPLPGIFVLTVVVFRTQVQEQ